MSELKPCPFCGSTDVDRHGWYDGQGQQGPECMGCGATARDEDAWNRRAAPEGLTMTPSLDASEQRALERFSETTLDDGTYDIGRPMVRRLADKGALRHLSAGRYQLTQFGQALLEAAQAEERQA